MTMEWSAGLRHDHITLFVALSPLRTAQFIEEKKKEKIKKEKSRISSAECREMYTLLLDKELPH